MGITPTAWWTKDTVAVVTGSNRGIGYEIVRALAGHGLTVVLTARDPAKGQAAIDALKAEGLQSVVFHPLEVSSSRSVQELATWLQTKFGGIDILVNNAAVLLTTFDYETAKLTVDTNYYAVKNVTKALLPLLRASPAGARIVNVSSRVGLYERFEGESLKTKLKDEENYSEELSDALATQYLEDVKAGRSSEADWPWISAKKTPMYSDSKVFLNVYAVALAKSLAKSQSSEDDKIFLASFCPGVTQTEMYTASIEGGFVVPEGFPIKSVADGAETGVWLALLPKEELARKNGKFFGEREEYPFGWVNPPL